MGYYKGLCHGNRLIMKGDRDYQTGNYYITYDDNVYTRAQNCANSLVDTLHQTLYGHATGIMAGNDTPYIQKNVWRSVVYTYDGQYAKLYIDCKLVLNYYQPGETFTNSYDLFFGNMNNAQYPYWFNGVMDEVRIYNRAINQAEVQAYSFGCADQTICSNWLSLKDRQSAVQLGDLDVTGQQLTIEAQINCTANAVSGRADDGIIIVKRLNTTSTNYLLKPGSAAITTSNGYFTTPQICDIKLNKTYHIAMVYDGSRLKFYRNGYLLSETACTGNLQTNDVLATIGETAGNAFTGFVNEVRVWKVARSIEDIRDAMNVTLPNPGTQSGLVASYSFEDLKNKQGEAKLDGTLLNNSQSNSSNPQCKNFGIDSCEKVVNTNNVLASFYVADTVCVNEPVDVVNYSANATTYHWNFCVADLNTAPTGTNLGNINNKFRLPSYIDYAIDDGKYYGFMTNNYPAGFVRLDFGNSLLNTPVVVDLGTLGGELKGYPQGIQIIKENGIWYAFITGGDTNGGVPSFLIKLTFGTSLTNTPTVTNWGNLGNLAYPHDLFMFKEGNAWFGFTVNYYGSSITRFSFGNNFDAAPVATEFRNVGGLNGPTGICPVNDNGTWRIFVTNYTNHTLSRIDFGNSLLNSPTGGVNMGNLGNLLHNPRDLYIFQFCDQTVGFIINDHTTTNVISRLNFTSLSLSPSITGLPAVGGINTPHSISKLFREGSDLFAFVPNTYDNGLSRISFNNKCNSVSMPSSTLEAPQTLTYSSPGLYNINLTVNEGLSSQTAFCKQIVVLPKPEITPFRDTSICPGSSLQLNTQAINATSFNWSPATDLSATDIASPVASPSEQRTYTLVAANGGCAATATASVAILPKCSQPVASFTAPDRVCVNTPVQITNTSTDASKYYWDFCVADLNKAPEAVNMGNFGNFTEPVFMDYAFDDGKYYGFVSNHVSGKLIRLDFGNSLLNTPTIFNLGNFGGILPSTRGSEGIQIVQNEGKWYVIIVAGNTPNGTAPPRVVKIDFGASLSNPAPIATNWGNLGAMYQPIDLHLFKENNNWYGFTVNAENNTISRFNFTSSFDNTPTGTNLGNIGNLNYPTGIHTINDNGSWKVFVVNGGTMTTPNQPSLTRLDFGSSLVNTPTGVNLGNISNVLMQPRDITIMRSCGQIIGFAVNGNGLIIKLDFNNNLAATPTAVSLGNLGNLSFPHSISKLFRINGDLYSFITNVSNNTITRLKFSGCTDPAMAGTSLQNPPPITYSLPGTYNINLTIDDGMPGQSSFCKSIVVEDCTPPVIPSFTLPDTVCINTPVTINNTSTGASSYYWNFCVSDFANTPPQGFNMGTIGGALKTPVFMDYIQENGNFYGFVANLNDGLVRLNFGNSLLNTPTSFALGKFGGAIPNGAEGLQVVKSEGKWYVILVGGASSNSTNPCIVKIELGTSITNNTPVVTNWGNIGGVRYPVDLHVFQEGNQWYGFTVDAEGNSVIRYSFGANFNNPPTAINFGNIGSLRYPTGIYAVKGDNDNWHVFVTNAVTASGNGGTASSLTRLDFGNSLLNTPTAVNLGNVGNRMSSPRDIYIVKLCGQIIGFFTNNSSTNDIVRMDFSNDLSKVPTAVSLGNIGNLNFPHSISKIFRVGADLYSFITNASNNTMTRLRFPGCSDASIPISADHTPPALSYTMPGIYNINLMVDEGLATQAATCRQITVVAPLPKIPLLDTVVCGDSIVLKSRMGDAYAWSNGRGIDTMVVRQTGIYWVDIGKECVTRDSFECRLNPAPKFELGANTAICEKDSLVLTFSLPDNPTYQWQDGSTQNKYVIKQEGKYKLNVTNSYNCEHEDSIQITTINLPVISMMNDTAICYGKNTPIKTDIDYAGGVEWLPSAGLSNPLAYSPVATPVKTTRYFLTAYNQECKSVDSILVSVLPNPVLSITHDTLICEGQSVPLAASGATTYSWLPYDGLSDFNIAQPVASPSYSGSYTVNGIDGNGCESAASVYIEVRPRPVFTLNPSYSSVCKGEEVLLTAGGGDSYSWSFNGLYQNINVSTLRGKPAISGFYTAAIQDKICKMDTVINAVVEVKALPKLVLTKSNDIDCLQGEAKLNVSGANTYSWSPAGLLSNSFAPNPVVKTDSTTRFYLYAKAPNGCVNTDSITVNVFKGNRSDFPVVSAFTPNGDGKNDCFRIMYWGYIHSFSMQVFNRWGQLIFQTTNPTECWDGKFNGEPQPGGTYVYMINAKTLCGPVSKKGTVVLIR